VSRLIGPNTKVRVVRKGSKKTSAKNSNGSNRIETFWNQLPERKKKLDVLRRAKVASTAQSSLTYYYNRVWSEGIRRRDDDSKAFVPAKHVDRWCGELQTHLFTSKKAPRNHLKSCTIYAFLSWLIFRRNRRYSVAYFSYSHDLASKHIKELKAYMRDNPYFDPLIHLTDAEGILRCKWPDLPYIYEVEPYGVSAASRGIHPHGVICDDILKDPTQRKLNLDQLDYINRMFKEKITMMPKRGGFLHCWGTPQDTEDLFALNAESKRFFSTSHDAVVSEKKKQSYWPEQYPWKVLMTIKKDIGEKAFNKELRCRPVRGEESYFNEEAITEVIDKQLPNLSTVKDSIRDGSYVVAGMDLGKKRHPSHFVVFRIEGTKLIQVHSKFLDNKDYTRQTEYVAEAEEAFSIDACFFDNTRGEFELFIEQDKLPRCMSIKRPVKKKDGTDGKIQNICAAVLSGKRKFAIAASFDRAVTKKRIQLLSDDRQRKLILSVDNDLMAPETVLGHGDSFWSVGLACQAAELYSDEFVGEIEPHVPEASKKDPQDQIADRYSNAPHGSSEIMEGLGSIPGGPYEPPIA